MFVFGVANQGVAVDHLDSLLAAQVDTLRHNRVTADELPNAHTAIRRPLLCDRRKGPSHAA